MDFYVNFFSSDYILLSLVVGNTDKIKFTTQTVVFCAYILVCLFVYSILLTAYLDFLKFDWPFPSWQLHVQS